MTLLEKLEDYAYNQNIDVLRNDMRTRKKGSCASLGHSNVIFLNTRFLEETAEELCTLAEEIGHIEYSAMLPIADYLHPSLKRWHKRKNEINAKRWAINELLTPEKIQRAIDNAWLDGDEGIAEYCNVTVNFLYDAMEHYRRKGIEFHCDCEC